MTVAPSGAARNDLQDLCAFPGRWQDRDQQIAGDLSFAFISLHVYSHANYGQQSEPPIPTGYHTCAQSLERSRLECGF
jgi:hypothetical protein